MLGSVPEIRWQKYFGIFSGTQKKSGGNDFDCGYKSLQTKPKEATLFEIY